MSIRLGIGVDVWRGALSAIAAFMLAFKTRVLADSGTFEAESYLLTQNIDNINAASFVYIPSSFKSGKLYSQKPTDGSGDLTFTRASSAVRNNAVNLLESMATNVGRVDYVNGEPTLLLELARTNIVPYSINFANAAWVKTFSAAITANATTSPDGTNNASMLSVGIGAFSGIYTVITGASGKYSNCIYAKKGTFNFVYFVDITGTTAIAWFNLNTGAVGTVASGYSAKITASINGFYKCEVTRTGSNQVPTYYQIGASSADNTNGGSTGNIYIYQAQSELGDYSTSPIVTNGASATRVADINSVTRTFTQNQTIFQKLYLNAGSLSDGVAYMIGDYRLSATNRISLYRYNNSFYINVENTTTQFSGSVFTIPTLVKNTIYKIAITCTTTGFKVFVNGVLVYTSAVISMPNLGTATLAIGCGATGLSQYNGSLGENYIFDYTMTDGAAILLTT